VKRYSSGMNARLGFAIAAHMNPDVLIVDEVLAVGDFSFQRKAFDRLNQMRKGLPVVLVSHQLDRVAALCTHCLLLDHGTVVKRGTPDECISHYLTNGARPGVEADARLPYAIDSVDAEPKRELRSGEWVRLTIRGAVRQPAQPHQRLAMRVRALHNGQTMFALDLSQREPALAATGPFEARIDLQANVGTGYYAVETATWDTIERRDLMYGPQTLFHVHEPGLVGVANLHPRVHVDRPSSGLVGEDGPSALAASAGHVVGTRP
jgi:ABC-type molybdate transport system ATPase subunit